MYQLITPIAAIVLILLGIFVITRQESPLYIITGWVLFGAAGSLITYGWLFAGINPKYVGMIMAVITTGVTVSLYLLISRLLPEGGFPFKLLGVTVCQMLFAYIIGRIFYYFHLIK